MAAMVEIIRNDAEVQGNGRSATVSNGAQNDAPAKDAQSDATGRVLDNAVGIGAADADGRASAVSVYEVPESDWEIWRDLRLDALADAPYAFGETLARAQSRTDEDWRSWWSDDEGTGPRYIGLLDGAPAGMCGILFPQDLDRAPLIISMWTSPSARGHGVARAMLDACVEYGEAAGYSRLLLGVVDDNLPARRLYERYGFVETGESEPLHSDPSKLVISMAKQLNAS
jgi:ribosomal protein S18 acetylase RimI-like enzyme